MKYSNQPSTVAVAPPHRWTPGGIVSPADADISNGIRKLGFGFALAVVFLRYSLLHEVLTYYSGVNTKILYLLAVPAFIFLIVSNGLGRVFSARQALYWLGFLCWLFITVPFSTWKGESLAYALTYVRTDLPMLFFLGGLAMTWKECRMLLYTIAVSGITSALFWLVFGSTVAGGRVDLTFGTMANANDYAAILILALPFIFFMMLRPMDIFLPFKKLVQLVALVGLLYCTYLILASGSRGALVAISACVLFVFLNSSPSTRIGLLVVIPLSVVAAINVLPSHTVDRLRSFSTDAKDKDDEAAESANMRQHYLEASVSDTFTHPVFGVGPGQFPNYEGKTKSFKEGGFVNPHNSYTQISSETGLPGAFFYLGGIFSTYLLIRRTWKQASRFPEAKEIRMACFCFSVSYIGFCIAIFFLNFGYFFYLPGFSGLAIVLAASAKREMDSMVAVPENSPAPSLAVFNWQRQERAKAAGPVRPAYPQNRFYR